MTETHRRTKRRVAIVAKDCFFCKEKSLPKYSDVSVLQKFTTERGKILGRTRSGVCMKHQRKLTVSIKYARHLALLPFVGGE